jgi:hypothetical protein
MLDSRRRNPNVTPATELTLSEAPRSNRNAELIRLARCGHALPAGSRRHARWCSNACRQSAYRARRAGPAEPVARVDERVENHGSGSRARRAHRSAPPVAVPRSGAHAVEVPHEHSPRLCAVCMEARTIELRRAPRARVNAELVARRIRADGGDVDGAAHEFGLEYSHANAIRRGFRGAGRTAEPIPYSSRGWTSGRRNGWSTLDRELEVIDGGAAGSSHGSAVG